MKDISSNLGSFHTVPDSFRIDAKSYLLYIRYVTLHVRFNTDRHRSFAHYRHRAKITVFICEQKP